MIHVDDATNPSQPPEATPPPLSQYATLTFVVLFAMHMLDYIDRWALSGVNLEIERDFHVGKAEVGSLAMYFLISYSIISPFMGYFGDRVKRTWLLALGVGVWSLATVGTGLAQDFFHLKLARSVLGIGEATYAVLAPTILMDLYPRHRRSRILSTFYLAMPIGYALGVILGSVVAKYTGSWRLAFFFVGAPGLIAAFASLFLPDPVRGESEGIDRSRLVEHERAGPSAADYKDLAVNSSYTYVVFGMAAFTFAFGGLAFWLPTFLEEVRGMDKAIAGYLLGGTGLLAAITGMTGGGWLADRLSNRYPKALFWVAGGSMLLAVPFVVLGLYSHHPVLIGLWLYLAQALMFANTGPSNAVIANVIAPNMRATAYAVSTFAIHFLGDVWSPMLMGYVADLCGQPDTMASPFGTVLRSLGAVPVGKTNLAAGMLVVVPAVALGGIVLLAGARHLPREMALMVARLRAPVEKTA